MNKQIISILSVALTLSLIGPMALASRNGTPVGPGQIPGVTMITSAEGNGSGVLISPDLVLTVNHVGGTGTLLSIQAFVDYDPTSAPTQIGIENRKILSVDLRSELTLLKLKTPVSFKGYPLTADLLTASQSLIGVGYGITTDPKATQNRKLSADVVFRDYARIPVDEQKNGEPEKDPNGPDIMAELSPGPKNQISCFGDSGGPIFAKKNEAYQVVGVTSHILNDKELKDDYAICKSAQLLRVVPVAAYRTWIDQSAKELGAKAPTWAD